MPTLIIYEGTAGLTRITPGGKGSGVTGSIRPDGTTAQEINGKTTKINNEIGKINVFMYYFRQILILGKVLRILNPYFIQKIVKVKSIHEKQNIC